MSIPGMWEDGQDAYLIIEEINRIESAYGESRELSCVDGDRNATIEWSDQDGLHISAVLQGRPLALSAVGLDDDTLVAWDDFKSLENGFEYDGHRFFYRNSYEAYYHKGCGASCEWDCDGGGYYTWEFVRNDEGAAITVVKSEGLPFEVYVSNILSPHLVTVYRK